MARPKKEVNIELVEELAGINCSFEEISHIVGVSVRTLHRSYGTVIKKGLETAKTSLKRKQFEVAMKGNPTMLIWLGKIMLGQKDKIETEGKSELTIIRKIVEFGEEKGKQKKTAKTQSREENE